MQRTKASVQAARGVLSTPGGGDLPSDRAFVLHLDARARPPRRMVGRAEHVTSGRVGHFTSLGELIVFLTDVLDASSQRE